MSRAPGSRPWLDVALAATLFVAALGLLLAVSRATGPCAEESGAVQAARAIGQWLDRAAREGAFVYAQPFRDSVVGPVHRHAQLPAFVSGLVWQVAAHRHDWLGELLALRFGSLLAAAAAVPLLYALVAPHWGRRAAVLSCALLVLVPRALHVAATASPDAGAAASWLLLAVLHMRSLRGRSVLWAIAAGPALGLALALSPCALLALAVLLAHALWHARRQLGPALRAGHVPAPALALPALVLGPVGYLLCTPWLWHDTSTRFRQSLAAWLSPQIVPTQLGGVLVSGPPLPKGLASLGALLSLPSVTLALLGVGAAVLVRRHAAGAGADLDRGTSPPGLGALCAIAIAVALGWPAVCPDTLAVFPPRWVLAIPFAACVAGLGLDTCLGLLERLVVGRRAALRRALVGCYAAVALAVPLVETVRSPATLSAAFAPLAGGPRAVAQSGAVPLHDGSVLAALAGGIDALGRTSVSVHGPGIAPEAWEALVSAGLLRTRVRAVPAALDADLVVVPGGSAGEALERSLWTRSGAPAPRLLAVAQRDGHVLMSLYRTGPR